MPRPIPYNRKINAPIKFLHYLEPFDLFIIGIFGFLLPLAASNFLPVEIPIWHNFLWLVALTFVLIIIKVGRAPGFIQHWLAHLLRPRLLKPGKKDVPYYILNPKLYEEHCYQSHHPDQPISREELQYLQRHLTVLKQTRKQEKVLTAHAEALQ